MASPAQKPEAEDKSAVDPLRERLRVLERELKEVRRELEGRRQMGRSQASFPLTALVFEAYKCFFAIEVGAVVEVTRMVLCSPLPGAPASVRGAVNRRGQIVPLVDLAVGLGREPESLGEELLIVFVQGGDRVFGLPVERVVEVRVFRAEDVDPTATLNSLPDFVVSLLQGGLHVVSLLEPGALLMAGELDQLAEALRVQSIESPVATSS